jgi:heme A synthase
MNWNRWIRQTHRWLSIAFTVAVIINGVAVLRGRYNNSLGLLAVFVLTLSFFTGVYLFFLPYATKLRRARVPE